MQTKTTFYIVRHGESEANIKKIYGLTPEADLTPQGVRQVRLLSAKLLPIEFAAIFTSDLKRAVRTAKILLDKRDIPVVLDKRLRERSYGRLNGKTPQEVQQELRHSYSVYVKMSNKDKYYFRLVEDMETVEETVLRYIAVLKDIAIKYAGKHILIVSHVIPMRGILVHFDFFKHHQIDSRSIANASYIKLVNEGSDFTVKEIYDIRRIDIKIKL